jgi:two-component system capsular synthesis sensor histidine kinase RcsC
MDGDIEVDSEPGMGSQFVVRIPIYAGQQPAPPLLDGLQEKAIWLDMRNDYLASFLLRLLQQQGIQAAYYQGQAASDDVIISDHDEPPAPSCRARIRICGEHIDMPQETAPGQWIQSSAMLHDLPQLLGRIYRININSDTATALPSPTPQAAATFEDIIVLIVDDHPINRMLLSEQLGTVGYQTKTAQDGVDALNVLSRNHIDIVLSDVNMPNMDGYRLTQRLRQLGHTFPVIGVTANALAEEKQRCMDAGMDNCLSKPVTLDVLKSTLATYAERVRKSREG